MCVCLPRVTGSYQHPCFSRQGVDLPPGGASAPETPGGACFFRGKCANPSSALGTIRLLLTGGMEKAHFQIRTLIDKKIFTLVLWTFYHTTHIKVVSRAANASVLFESVHIFPTYTFVREQYGTERSSGPH